MTGSRNRTGELLAVLAHELRNPLASLQGCAITLLERRDDLSPEMRDGLTRVIVDQSQRLDWLIRATATFGGATGARMPDAVDLATVVADATEYADVKVDVQGSATVHADPKRLRIALEALVFSLRSGGGSVSGSFDGSHLRLRSTARDLGQGERRWKLDLARRVLREEACDVAVRRTKDGTSARVTFRGEDGHRAAFADADDAIGEDE